jgi:hypothetical protein
MLCIAAAADGYQINLNGTMISMLTSSFSKPEADAP